MWHFTIADRILGYGDGREVMAGKKLKVKCEPILCKSGLHACKNILDACDYAPGAYLWQVKLSGKVIRGNNKSVATERLAVWGYDATEVLRKFSRVVALDTITKYWDKTKLGKFPDVVKQWLETGDESLRSAAWSAAWSAESAESAARSAGSAAGSAAESAHEKLLTKMILAGRPRSKKAKK